MPLSTDVKNTLKERVDFIRNAIGYGKPFNIDPDIRRELILRGLDSFGLKLCHELAGDGIHDNAGGTFFMFVNPKKSNQTKEEPSDAKESKLGQQGNVQGQQGSTPSGDAHPGGTEDPGGQDGGGLPLNRSTRPADGG